MLPLVFFKGTNFKDPVKKFTDAELESMQLRYYSSDVHSAAFTLPRFAQKVLSSAISLSDRNNNPGDSS